MALQILIIKSSALGDIIHSFDLLVYLKKKYKQDVQIDWVVEKPNVELCSRHPLIDNVITIDSKKWRKNLFDPEISLFRKKMGQKKYDVAFDLQGNIKSALVLLCVKAKKKVGFGRKSVAEWPNLLFTNQRFNPPKGQNIRQDYLYLVQRYFGDQTPVLHEPIALQLTEQERDKLKEISPNATVVAAGSRWPNKELGETRLIAELQKLRGPFIFVGKGESERARAEALAAHFPDNSSLLPEVGLALLQNILARVSLVVSMDSLVLHLCGTTNTPSLSFFGPSLAVKYAPVGEQHKSVQGSCPYGRTFEKRCPILRTCKTGACLKGAPL